MIVSELFKTQWNERDLREVVDLGLGQHRVVFQLRLPQWWGVAAACMLASVVLVVATVQCRCECKFGEEEDSYAMMTSLAFPDRRDLRVEEYPRVTFPDFMTRANLELIESAVFSVGNC